MKISEELQACLEVSGWKGEKSGSCIHPGSIFLTREANGEREVLFQNITGNLVYASPLGREVVSFDSSLPIATQATLLISTGAIDASKCRTVAGMTESGT